MSFIMFQVFFPFYVIWHCITLKIKLCRSHKTRKRRITTRQVSSMIHSARPTVSPVANIVFAWNLFCFAKFWKVGTDERTDGQHVRKQWSLWFGRVDQQLCLFRKSRWLREISVSFHIWASEKYIHESRITRGK